MLYSFWKYVLYLFGIHNRQMTMEAHYAELTDQYRVMFHSAHPLNEEEQEKLMTMAMSLISSHFHDLIVHKFSYVKARNVPLKSASNSIKNLLDSMLELINFIIEDKKGQLSLGTTGYVPETLDDWLTTGRGDIVKIDSAMNAIYNSIEEFEQEIEFSIKRKSTLTNLYLIRYRSIRADVCRFVLAMLESLEEPKDGNPAKTR